MCVNFTNFNLLMRIFFSLLVRVTFINAMKYYKSVLKDFIYVHFSR